MLRIAKEPVVMWPVKILEPQDGGEPKPTEVKFRLRLLLASSLKDELASIGLAMTMANGDAGAIASLVTQTADAFGEKIAQHVVGWEGLVDEADAPLEFTEENKRAVLDRIYVRRAVLVALIAASRGDPARKN